MSNTSSKGLKVTRQTLVQMLGGGLAGGVLGALGARATFEADLPPLSGPEVVLIGMPLMLILPLLVVWHELGHMAGGRLVGFRPLLLAVGPVRWQKQQGRWRLSVNRKVAMAGGLAVCAPDDSRDVVRRTTWFIAGGPLSNLLGGAAGVGLWAALPALHPQSGLPVVAAYAVLAVFAFGNLFLGLLSLAPTRTGGFYSDGARLLRIWRGGPEIDREVAILLLTGSTVGGLRPRDWDPDLVRRAVGQADGSLFHGSGLQLAFAHAEDRGVLDEARGYRDALLQAEEAFPDLLRPALRLSTVYFTACHDRDRERVREIMATAEGGLLLDPHVRHLAQAAAAWIDGDAARAGAELDRAEAELPRAMDRGEAIAAADRIAHLRALLAEVPAREPLPA